ncbi:hypothetical protein NDU88_005505 [Pleurodeles waltl]|uniref:Uncharacterized protein n=1 Tax=Pleurodeles waltl TaxID=8319 RepID=A0AAV7QKU6_PLEWA|nr:hypothetical protein NDU88_005505 [Pleurodeles waltl]
MPTLRAPLTALSCSHLRSQTQVLEVYLRLELCPLPWCPPAAHMRRNEPVSYGSRNDAELAPSSSGCLNGMGANGGAGGGSRQRLLERSVDTCDGGWLHVRPEGLVACELSMEGGSVRYGGLSGEVQETVHYRSMGQILGHNSSGMRVPRWYLLLKCVGIEGSEVCVSGLLPVCGGEGYIRVRKEMSLVDSDAHKTHQPLSVRVSVCDLPAMKASLDGFQSM